jgi:hypothetical protein
VHLLNEIISYRGQKGWKDTLIKKEKYMGGVGEK